MDNYTKYMEYDYKGAQTKGWKLLLTQKTGRNILKIDLEDITATLNSLTAEDDEISNESPVLTKVIQQV